MDNAGGLEVRPAGVAVDPLRQRRFELPHPVGGGADEPERVHTDARRLRPLSRRVLANEGVDRSELAAPRPQLPLRVAAAGLAVAAQTERVDVERVQRGEDSRRVAPQLRRLACTTRRNNRIAGRTGRAPGLQVVLVVHIGHELSLIHI